METEHNLTELIGRYQEGDRMAFEQLVASVYDHLHRIAHNQLSNHKRDAVVNTTVVVHEAYLRLQDQEKALWQNRNHFLAVAATAMRQIIIDFARRHQAGKRGGGEHHVNLDDTQIGFSPDAATLLLDIDAAFHDLLKSDERTARVFECRYFGGMTDDETAEALSQSLRTVQREWKKAKAFFSHRLGY